MKTIVLNKHSWHWRLASFYGPLDTDDTNTDMCTYTRAVLRGLFIVFTILIVSGVFCLFIGAFFGWLAAMVSLGIWIAPEDTAIIGGTFVGMGLFVIMVISQASNIDKFFQNRLDLKLKQESALRNSGKSELKHGFWIHAYRSLKQNICVRIRIE